VTSKPPVTAEELRATALRVQHARFYLDATLEELQRRLDPRSLASSAIENVRERGTEVAVEARQVASDRPYQVAAAAGVVSLLLAWKPFQRWRRSVRAKKDRHAGLVQVTNLSPPSTEITYARSLEPPVIGSS
jgi:hypothetical protein